MHQEDLDMTPSQAPVSDERIEALLYDILPNTKIHAEENHMDWSLSLADTQVLLRELLRTRALLRELGNYPEVSEATTA